MKIRRSMSNWQIWSIVAIALFLFAVVVVIMPATAAAVSVNRDLPDKAYPGEEIDVSLTQTDFHITGYVTETLPEGFRYQGLSLSSGGETRDYDETTNNLTIEFREETTITYVVKAGTAEQIKNAEFSGTWGTIDRQGDKINGDVTGDTTLTLGEEPTPTPTPGATVTVTPTPTATLPPTPPAGTLAHIALGANPADIPADGVSTSTLIASVWNGEDWVLDNLTVNFNTSLGKITASAVIENGTAKAILTAGKEEGVATITAEANLSGDIGIVTNTTAVNFSTPGVTPTPTPTPPVTVSPTPTATPKPSPTPTSSPAGETPGFETVFAIAGLLAVAYLVLRGRKA